MDELDSILSNTRASAQGAKVKVRPVLLKDRVRRPEKAKTMDRQQAGWSNY